MSVPRPRYALVDPARLRDALAADPILFVTPGEGRNLNMNHRGITAALLFEIDLELVEETLTGTRPVGKSIERSAVTEHNCGLRVCERNGLEGTLYMKDGLLCGAPAFRHIGARKAAAEDNTRSLRSDRDVSAKIAPGHLEHRSLATARAAGQDEQFRVMPFLLALAGMGANG